MMQKTSPKWIALSAAVVLALGAGAAAQQWIVGSGSGIENTESALQQIERIYRKLAEQRPPQTGKVSVTPAVRSASSETEAPRPRVTSAVHIPTPAPLPSAPEDPTGDLALQAVTRDDGKPLAWFLKISNRETAEAGVGQEAFGFQVAAISAETVSLKQDGKTYELHLGEKNIPAIVPPKAGGAAVASAGGQSGRGGRRSFAFAGRRGGPSAADRERIRKFFESRFGGSRGGSSGGSRFSFNRGSSSRGSRSSSRRRGTDPRQFFQAVGDGFRASRDAGRARAQFQSTRASFGHSGSNGSYANPQTARRTGGRNISGTSSSDSPSTITNPQTSRRTGQTPGGGNGAPTGGGTSRSGSSRGGSDSRSGR